jgi:hypothetical protein
LLSNHQKKWGFWQTHCLHRRGHLAQQFSNFARVGELQALRVCPLIQMPKGGKSRLLKERDFNALFVLAPMESTRDRITAFQEPDGHRVCCIIGAGQLWCAATVGIDLG